MTSTEHVVRPEPAPTGPAVGRKTTAGTPPSGRSEQRYRSACAIAAGSVVLFGLWLAAGVGSAETRRLVSDLVFVTAPTVAAASCWHAHRVRAAGTPAGPGGRGLPDLGRGLGGWTVYQTLLVAPSRSPRSPTSATSATPSRSRSGSRSSPARPATCGPAAGHRLAWSSPAPAAHQRGVGPRPDPERDGPDLHPRRRPGLPAGRRGRLLDRALALRGAAGLRRMVWIPLTSACWSCR